MDTLEIIIVPVSRDHYAASHIQPDKMYSCIRMCRKMEAGAQWISAQPSPVWNHEENFRVMCPSSIQATQPLTQGTSGSVY